MTLDERETIITFDETPADAIIFTYNKTWQIQMEKKLGIKPSWDNGFGGKEYRIPKKRIRMPQAPKKLSPEQKEKLARQLSRGRHEKSIISSKSTTAQGKSQANFFPLRVNHRPTKIGS
jgi:hypothetical protein